MRPYNFDKEILESLYNKEGMTLKQIAERLNCSKDCVYDYFVKYNIPRRRKSRIANLLFLKPKSKFIENLNPIWIVGFVDGEATFGFRFEKKFFRLYPFFSISQKDKSPLKRIKSCFPDILFTIGNSPKNPTWNLKCAHFNNCVKLFPFFDKYYPIAKKDQYDIWKFLIKELITSNFTQQMKAEVFEIYKKFKQYNEFKQKYYQWRMGGLLEV